MFFRFAFAVISTGVTGLFLACGVCTPGYGVEKPLFDLHTFAYLTVNLRERLHIPSPYLRESGGAIMFPHTYSVVASSAAPFQLDNYCLRSVSIYSL